jgi:hypothetical protein
MPLLKILPLDQMLKLEIRVLTETKTLASLLQEMEFATNVYVNALRDSADTLVGVTMQERKKAMKVVALYDEIRTLFTKLWNPFVLELHSPHAARNKEEGSLLDNFYLPQLLAVLYSSIGNSSTTRPWPMLVLQSEYMLEDEKRAFRGLLVFFHPGQSVKQGATMTHCVTVMARRQIPFGAGLNGVQALPRVNTGVAVMNWWTTPVFRRQPSLFEALSSKTAKLRSQFLPVPAP